MHPKNRDLSLFSTRVRRIAHAIPRVMKAAHLATYNLLGRGSLVNDGAQNGVDVSLTSYGYRLRLVFMTIESVGRGSIRPDRLILWVDDPKALERLPRTLRRLQRRGLEVKLSSNFGPHTKYLPYLRSELNNGTFLVTADDDCLYDKSWLEGLVEAARARPTLIHAHRARRVRAERESFMVAPYLSWPAVNDTHPGHSVFFMGVCGVIYPHAFLEQLRDSSQFPDDMRGVDDIWLNLRAIETGVKAAQVSSASKDYPHIPFSQKDALSQTNLEGGGNDLLVRRHFGPQHVQRITASSETSA